MQGRGPRRRHRRARRRRAGRRTRRPRRPAASRTRRAWWAAFEAACAEAGVADATVRRRSPSAASSTGWSCSTPPARCCGRPSCGTTPSRRPTPPARRRSCGGAAAWADACGSVPSPASPSPSWRGCAAASPTCSRAVATVLLPHDWLTSQLTGRRTTDRGDASGTGYWSPAEERYRLDLLALVDARSRLGRAAARGARARRGRPASGRRAPSSARAPATTWPPRSASGLRPGDVALSLGTSGTAFTRQRHADRRPHRHRRRFADATGRFLPLVCTLNATKVTDAVAAPPRRRPRRASTTSPWPRRAGCRRARPRALPRRRAHAEPPDATGTLAGLRTDVDPRAARPGRGRGRGVQPARRRDALGARRPADGPAAARRRRRPQPRPTASRRRPHRPTGRRARRRTSSWPAAPRSRPPPCSRARRFDEWPRRGASARASRRARPVRRRRRHPGGVRRRSPPRGLTRDRRRRPALPDDPRREVAQIASIWFTELARGDRPGSRPDPSSPHGIGHVTRSRPTGAAPASAGGWPTRSSATGRADAARHPRDGPRGVDGRVLRPPGRRSSPTAPASPRPGTRRWPRVATVIGRQLRAVGARMTLAPVLDVARDPRWGRVEETYGEDPELAAGWRWPTSGACSRGRDRRGQALPGPRAHEGGMNQGWVSTGSRHLGRCGRAVRRGDPRGRGRRVMTSYSSSTGSRCAAAATLTDLLRGELGFDGVRSPTTSPWRTSRLPPRRGAADPAARRPWPGSPRAAGLDCYGTLRAQIEDGTSPSSRRHRWRGVLVQSSSSASSTTPTSTRARRAPRSTRRRTGPWPAKPSPSPSWWSANAGSSR